MLLLVLLQRWKLQVQEPRACGSFYICYMYLGALGNGALVDVSNCLGGTALPSDLCPSHTMVELSHSLYNIWWITGPLNPKSWECPGYVGNVWRGARVKTTKYWLFVKVCEYIGFYDSRRSDIKSYFILYTRAVNLFIDLKCYLCWSILLTRFFTVIIRCYHAPARKNRQNVCFGRRL